MAEPTLARVAALRRGARCGIVDAIRGLAAPGSRAPPHEILQGGGHFLQEDIPEAYNRALLAWLRASQQA